MSRQVLLMHASCLDGDPSTENTVVCSSEIVAYAWREAYQQAGWQCCYVSHWQPIRIERPDATTFPQHNALDLPPTPEEDEAFNAIAPHVQCTP